MGTEGYFPGAKLPDLERDNSLGALTGPWGSRRL
jgi:hypothetical protein